MIKQDMVIIEMNRKLAYYENPHPPPSGNNIPARKKKSERRNISRGQAESKADKKGWRLTSSQVFADRCKKCNSTGLTHKKIDQKQVSDIVFTVQTKTHCSYKSMCRCVRQHARMAKEKLIHRSNLTALGTLAWYNASSLTSIKEFFGLKVCKRTIKNMITSTIPSMKIGRLSREYEIWQNGRNADNSREPLGVWINQRRLRVHSHTRSAVVSEQRYWFCLDKPITVDEFVGYEFELW